MSSEIGYGKPPKRTQFKKGVSGNPKGRPRADHNSLGEIFRRTLAQTVRVTENGRIRSILEAAFTQLQNQAAKGEARALKLPITILQHFNGKPLPDGAVPLNIEIVRFTDFSEKGSS